MTLMEPAASRLEPLPTLPVFFKLRGRRAVVAGGGQPAAWKAELLAAAGAEVVVVTSEPCQALEGLATDLGEAVIRLVRRDWVADDFVACAIAIGAIEHDEEAARFRQAAHAAGVPVNVIDRPVFCDFQFGTLVSRGPLVVAITTDGAAPVLGQALRLRLEALLPAALGAWTSAAKAWRPAVAARNWSFQRRRRFWELVSERALAPDAGEPDEATLHSCFAAVESAPALPQRTITLVGCGTGSADELTVAALRALQGADLVVQDPDVSPDAANLARREAGKRLVNEDEHALRYVLDQSSQVTRVVWLGTGDASSCPHWLSRRTQLGGHFTDIHQVPGVARCRRCSGGCRLLHSGDEATTPTNALTPVP